MTQISICKIICFCDSSHLEGLSNGQDELLQCIKLNDSSLKQIICHITDSNIKYLKEYHETFF